MSKGVLPRLQLFEFSDQAWLPRQLREGFLDALLGFHQLFRPYHRLHDTVLEWAGTRRLLDLASGPGEHIVQLVMAAESTGTAGPTFVLSDLFPDIDRYSMLRDRYGRDKLDFHGSPVSIEDLGRVPERYWSIFTGFHHLPPATAREFIIKAAQSADGLCIAEVTSRRVLDFLLTPLGLPVYLIIPFLAPRFSMTKFIFTSLIPIIPLMVIFDALVSSLRNYSADEIIAMIPEDLAAQFEITQHEALWQFAPMHSSLLLLKRKDAA